MNKMYIKTTLIHEQFVCVTMLNRKGLVVSS